MGLKIKVKKLIENAQIPTFGSKEAIGADIYSAEDVTLEPHEFKTIGTGISIQPNQFCDIQIRPRSGLAAKHGITVLNSPGTIDPDYSGEVKVILINHSSKQYEIKKGDRIAQLVALDAGVLNIGNGLSIACLFRTIFVETKELNETERSSGGFGSTGK